MPDSDEEAQRQVFEAFGIHACLQICVVWAIFEWQGCHYHCTHRLREVLDLLDAIDLYKTWKYCGCNPSETSRRTVC